MDLYCFLVFLIATDLVGKDPGDIQDWLQELTDRCYDETGCACYGKFVLRPQNRQGMKLEYLTNKIDNRFSFFFYLCKFFTIRWDLRSLSSNSFKVAFLRH